MTNEQIAARYEIERAISADSQIITVRETTHALAGSAYHIEVDQVLGAHFPTILDIINKYDLILRVSAQQSNVVLSISLV